MPYDRLPIPFVSDAGDVVGCSPAEIDDLRAAPTARREMVDVVDNASCPETRAPGATLAVSPWTERGRYVGLRAALDLAALVRHCRREASVATADGVRTVATSAVDAVDRHTRGGARFAGGPVSGLATGLAAHTDLWDPPCRDGGDGSVEDIAALAGPWEAPSSHGYLAPGGEPAVHVQRRRSTRQLRAGR